MATTIIARKRTAGRRLLTAADVAALPDMLPSGKVRYELDDGELVIMAPTGDEHGSVELKLAATFLLQGERPGHGKARCGESGIILRRNPDRVVGADAVFIANSALPLVRSPEGYLETIPTVVAEVRSKNETMVKIADKVGEYHQAGVQVVLVADPARQTITIHRRGVEPVILHASDTLRLDDIIPGYAVRVGEVFEE